MVDPGDRKIKYFGEGGKKPQVSAQTVEDFDACGCRVGVELVVEIDGLCSCCRTT